MNNNLHMDAQIESDLDVIPRSKLDKYLKSQRGTSFGERIIHSVIEACMESEKSKVVLDGLFNSLHKEQVNMAMHALSSLRTWDLIGLYGGRVIQGDAISLNIAGKSLDLKKMQSAHRIDFKWGRNKLISLASALFTNRPLGRVRITNEISNLNPIADYIKFHVVGEPKPSDIALKYLNWICRG